MFCCTNDIIDNDINKNTINLHIRYLLDDCQRKHQIIEEEQSIFTNMELIDREYLKHSDKQPVQPSFLSYASRHPKK